MLGNFPVIENSKLCDEDRSCKAEKLLHLKKKNKGITVALATYTSEYQLNLVSHYNNFPILKETEKVVNTTSPVSDVLVILRFIQGQTF